MLFRSFDVDSPSNTTSFSINGTAGDINQKTGIINVTMPYGSDISTVIPAVILQEGATSNLAINTPIDFTKSVKFRVINGNLFKDYTVNVTVLSPIKSFIINGLTATINDVSKTISLTLPDDTNLTALKPVIELSQGVTITPASGATVDFTNPVNYVITSAGKSVTYTANIVVPLKGLVVAFLGTAATRAEITNMDEITASNWLFENFKGDRKSVV